MGSPARPIHYSPAGAAAGFDAKTRHGPSVMLRNRIVPIDGSKLGVIVHYNTTNPDHQGDMS
jgi:hypothetical protein